MWLLRANGSDGPGADIAWTTGQGTRNSRTAFDQPPAHGFGIQDRAGTSVLGGRRSDVAVGLQLASHVWSLNRRVGGRGKPNFPQPAMPKGAKLTAVMLPLAV